MQGKHRNPLLHAAAWSKSWRLRRRLSGLVQWEPMDQPLSGCTVIIGMCSRLPHVLTANLRCLAKSRWTELRAVVVAVDATDLVDRQAIERRAQQLFSDIPVQFTYYSKHQSRVADDIRLPCPYAWLSWCIALREVKTQHTLIHDYDALILGKTLQERYKTFCTSNAKVQGITWYATNGVEPSDRLATTFEQFCDSQWLRSLHPLELFNVLRIKNGRSIHYDITLDVQERLLDRGDRQIMPMNADELVHPSQMIHQYTMFGKYPARSLPCSAMPMIPFFSFLGGDDRAFDRAVGALRHDDYRDVDLFGDGTRVNLSELDVAAVDWSCKQMVQAALKLGVEPNPSIYAYGVALYGCAKASAADLWAGDFTSQQRQWIEAASATLTA